MKEGENVLRISRDAGTPDNGPERYIRPPLTARSQLFFVSRRIDGLGALNTRYPS
jgi:hypothetical protein